MLSEFDYWQFWRNTADADVIRFMKIFTEISIEEINKMSSWEGSELNTAKKILADEATKLLHGEDSLKSIHETTQSLFSEEGGNNLDSLPKIQLEDELLNKLNDETIGISIIELLIKVGFATSKNEAKKIIRNGGARINDEKVEHEMDIILKKDFDNENRLKLSMGKKKHVLIIAN